MQEASKNDARTSYNKGLEKEKGKTHNIPLKKQAKTAVEQKKQTDIVDPLALFSNIEDDAISTE